MTPSRTIPMHDLLEPGPDMDFDKPVPANAELGVLIEEEQFLRRYKDSELPYPPLADKAPGCTFDPQIRKLAATVWGKVSCSDEGVRVEPSWSMNDDKTLLSLEVDHEDCFGAEVSLGRLMAAMPPDFENVELDTEAIENAVEEAKELGGPAFAVVARGEYPEEGRDARLKLSFSPDQVAGTLREDGTMDFRERGGMHFAAEGDQLAVLRPPVPGKPGKTIFGHELPPPQPRELVVKCGEGVSEAPGEEGTTLYTAAKDGIANYQHGVLTVTEMLEIKGDVDLETGNVRSKSGAVSIRGNVRAGFRVEAPGDIVVGEVVEEADLEAGGSVTVAGGVLMNGKNTLVAGGAVTAKFCQNAVIRAGGDVMVEAELSHCDVQAGGKVHVTGGKGMVSGGRVECVDGLEAAYLGNEARSKTIVTLRAVGPEEERLMEGRNVLAEELGRLDRAVGAENAMNTLMTAPEEERRILAELVKVRARIQADIRSIDDTIAEERKHYEDHLVDKLIKVRRKAYCGVVIVMGRKRFAVTEDMDAPTFKWDAAECRVVAE